MADLHERILDMHREIKEIKLALAWQKDRTDMMRIYKLEECVLKLANAVELLLEAKEKTLWPV